MANYSERGSEVRYELLDDGTFVIENYNLARPFASFFPGIAGLKGIPLWAFYVNRNQGVTSFGVKNKNYSLMEFYAANNAYGMVPNLGFRTFIKIRKNDDITFYEPFTTNPACATSPRIIQKMFVRAYEVVFEEVNETLGLKTSVQYFTLPQEPIAALVRIVKYENIGEKELDLEIIDGLPKVIPYWMSADVLKSMSYTAQAWTTVTNFKMTGLPFYRLKVEISDNPEVHELKKGNFYFGLTPNGAKLEPVGVAIDPEVVFGQDTSLSYPHEFMKSKDFVLPDKQIGENKYPAGMSFFAARLQPGGSRTLYSMAGHIESEEALNAYVKRVATADYFTAKARENKDIIETLTSSIKTESGEKTFDLYCRQTYLDNLLRGGMPIKLRAGDRDMVYYVYSRKHGDLERDYNNFQLSPSYYSQGNGNYRDANQNKRNDVFFNPWIKDFNVIAFYNLLQLDGYNPLLVKGYTFFFDVKGKQEQKLLRKLVDKDLMKAQLLFEKHFEPGGLLLALEEENIALNVAPEEFLRQVLALSDSLHDAEHMEGFWVDHWTYNLDLLETYLTLYPEKEREILLEKKEFSFYDNPNVVVPRAEKYVDSNGKIRQFDAVVLSTAKAKLLRERTSHVHSVHTKKGKGIVYRTTLVAKLFSLIVNKLATLDSEGIGIEMEAGKPGWYDALNGLPGIFGSSVCETFELKRLMQFLLRRLAALNVKSDYRIILANEICDFFRELDALLDKREKLSSFDFWDRATTLKENFRQQTLFGVSGKEKSVKFAELKYFLEKALDKINEGLAKAKDAKTGLYYTYLSYEAVSFKRTKNVSHHGWPCVSITRFRKKPLPLFLEAEVHYIKTEEDVDKVRALHHALKNSELFDANLNMYKVNASLEGQPADLGRCTVFSRGWLENESVWLHMEYKYLLELLKTGLYDEFFTEFRKAGVCFQDPEVYGRSILENSSFIASSAFPDRRIWGRGYVARLSGSTAEFLSMWMLMTQGAKPFRQGEGGELELHLKPVLPGGFFGATGTFVFNFLGTTAVQYTNPKKIDTYAASAEINRIEIEWNNGTRNVVNGAIVRGSFAEKIRNGEARRIEATL